MRSIADHVRPDRQSKFMYIIRAFINGFKCIPGVYSLSVVLHFASTMMKFL